MNCRRCGISTEHVRCPYCGSENGTENSMTPEQYANMKPNQTSTAGARTQHTPGPWTAGAFDDKVGHRIFAQWGEVGNFIAARANEGRDRNSNGYADARLIAAAPELLEACKNAADWLSRSARDDDHGEAQDLREVIAKVEGQVTEKS